MERGGHDDVGPGLRRLNSCDHAVCTKVVGRHEWWEGSRSRAAAQIISQGLPARIHAYCGHHAQAIELANSVVELAAQTDLLSQRADSLLDLAHVLAAANRHPGEHATGRSDT